MEVKVGTFAAATATGDQVVSGLGFTPKALILWTTTQTGAGFTNGLTFAWGIADDVITQRGFCTLSVDNVASSDVERERSTTSIINIIDINSATLRAGAVTAYASGQFTINWSTVDANAIVIHYVAFGGADLTAYVGAVTMTDPTTALPFLPRVVFHTGCLDTSANAWKYAMGWFVRDGNDLINGQGVVTTMIEDARNPSDTWRYQRDAQFFASLGDTTGALGSSVAVSNWGMAQPDQGTATNMDFLALGGNVQGRAAAINAPTSPGTQAQSGFGFTPKMVGFMSAGMTTAATVQAEARASLGFADGVAQGHTWYGDLDAVTPTVNAVRSETTSVVSMNTPTATGSSSTTEAEAVLDSLDVDGFTLDWTTADATARELLYLALGDRPAGAAIHIATQAPAIVSAFRFGSY